MEAMDHDANQPIIGRFSLWISDIKPEKAYWSLLLLDYGIYNPDNKRIENLLNNYEVQPLMNSFTNPFSNLSVRSDLDVTLDFFLWLYTEDKQTCFDIMKHIYEDFKDDDDVPDPYEYVDILEKYEKGGQYPDVDIDDMAHAIPQVIGDNAEFDFYNRLRPHFKEATEEIFIVDSYVDEGLFELYFYDTSPDVEKRILTKKPQGNFDAVAEQFTRQNGHRVEVRCHPECHDRVLFIDDRCFAVGISIKDGGRKPTYVIEFESVGNFRKPWEELWKKSDQYDIYE